MLRNDFLNMETITADSIRVPHFENAINEPIESAFGEVLVEETASGHFYSDTHTMAADKAPMIEMCHIEDRDNFSDHIIATYLGEFGEIED